MDAYFNKRLSMWGKHFLIRIHFETEHVQLSVEKSQRTVFCKRCISVSMMETQKSISQQSFLVTFSQHYIQTTTPSAALPKTASAFCDSPSAMCCSVLKGGHCFLSPVGSQSVPRSRASGQGGSVLAAVKICWRTGFHLSSDAFAVAVG